MCNLNEIYDKVHLAMKFVSIVSIYEFSKSGKDWQKC